MLAIGIDPGTAICGFGLVEMIGCGRCITAQCLRIKICCRRCG